MGAKKRRNRRGRRPRQRRARNRQTWLATIKLPGGGDDDRHDDCPICRAMGIDLDETSDVDLRPIESDDQMLELMALFDALGDKSSN